MELSKTEGKIIQRNALRLLGYVAIKAPAGWGFFS